MVHDYLLFKVNYLYMFRSAQNIAKSFSWKTEQTELVGWYAQHDSLEGRGHAFCKHRGRGERGATSAVQEDV